MEKLNLAGKWIFREPDFGVQLEADVPTSNLKVLYEAGLISDPLADGDDKKGAALGERACEFSKSFHVSRELLDYEHVHFYAYCLDTLCSIYINGKMAYRSENAFLPVDVDIKELLAVGENTVSLKFDPPVTYIKKRFKERPLMKNFNGVDGIAYIRKPACHFGWDWGPCVPYCGIGGAVELVGFNRRVKISQIRQTTTKEKSAVTVLAENAESIYILSPEGERYFPDKDGLIVIKEPLLWYTRELSQKELQPLYTVVAEGHGQRVEKKIGLRSIVLDTGRDEYGSNFCFVLNGERVFAKGANLIPFSVMQSDDDEEIIDSYLDMCVKSNFNMLRVWGGGSYASDLFLEKCDRLGILVWQDFCFACQMYPFYEDEFSQSVLKEIRFAIERTSHHACLAVYCGNNEIETMYSYLPKTSKLVKSYESFFYSLLPPIVSQLSDAAYIPTSPIGSGAFKDCSSDNVGDTHMWNVWHGLKKLDYYAKRYTRFLSEFGLESLPSMKAIKSFAKSGEDLSLDSRAFMNHQKCVGGNKKMLFYLTEMFDFPKHFEDLPYLTGIVQAMCVKNATVHFRQNKGRCNGSLFWQLNDVWNCPSWSAVDFEKMPKALMYMARQFFDPVTVTVRRRGGRVELYAHNDTLERVEFTVKAELLGGESRSFNARVDKNSFKKIGEMSVSRKSVLRLSFLDKSVTEVFAPPRRLGLKKANLEVNRQGEELKIKSDVFCYNVFIEGALASDNCFSLWPGEEKTVLIDGGEPVIKCAGNIEFKKGALSRAAFRLLYRLRPMNIANYFYYSLN